MTFEKPDFNFITLDAGTSTTSGNAGGVESCRTVNQNDMCVSKTTQNVT